MATANISTGNHLSCTLNSACDCVQVLCSMVELMSQRAGLSDKETNRVVVAADELFANIGRHGYHGEEGSIEMQVEYDGSSLRFEFRDYAPPMIDVDEKTLHDRAMHTGKTQPGGLGLSLIYAIMDEVRHQSLDDGNRWSLIRYLNKGVGNAA